MPENDKQLFIIEFGFWPLAGIDDIFQSKFMQAKGFTQLIETLWICITLHMNPGDCGAIQVGATLLWGDLLALLNLRIGVIDQ